MEEYHVLQDFTYLVKASGYIVAGIAFIVFVFFWFYVTGGESKRRE